MDCVFSMAWYKKGGSLAHWDGTLHMVSMNPICESQSGSSRCDVDLMAVFLYCCPACPSCPADAIQMGQGTWTIRAAIKKCSMYEQCIGFLDNACLVYTRSAVLELW